MEVEKVREKIRFLLDSHQNPEKYVLRVKELFQGKTNIRRLLKSLPTLYFYSIYPKKIWTTW
jgi:hypothetical protein